MLSNSIGGSLILPLQERQTSVSCYLFLKRASREESSREAVYLSSALQTCYQVLRLVCLILSLRRSEASSISFAFQSSISSTESQMPIQFAPIIRTDIHQMQFFRKLSFLCKGYFNFTNDTAPLPPITTSLQSKNIIVTGANSGIGYALAKAAAGLGANVFMVCRNKQRGEEALNKLRQQTKGGKLDLLLCDVSSIRQILLFCEKWNNSGKKIDALVLNAGVMVNTRQMTSQGLQTNFATNTLGTHAMTVGLLPSLQSQSKVIVVSSGGMLTQKLRTEDLFMEKEDFDGTVQYARNKRHQVALMQHYAKKYKDFNFYSMHPGWADTPGVKTSMPDFHDSFKNKLKTPEEGADTILYLIAEACQKLTRGEFYYQRQVTDKHLTLGGTKYDQKDVQGLVNKLDDMIAKLQKS